MDNLLKNHDANVHFFSEKNSNFNPKLYRMNPTSEQVWWQAAQEKASQDNLSMEAFLEVPLLRKPLFYADYIALDTLLTLQNPLTDYPDEQIFIVYHQITELYFSLMQHEIKQLQSIPFDKDIFSSKIKRLIAYTQALTKSFSVMENGMDTKQFLIFRKALSPASGFQSVQFRQIEFALTPLQNLLHIDYRSQKASYQHVYWKMSGDKTPTLKAFEKRYDETLQQQALFMQGKTLAEITQHQTDTDFLDLLKTLDYQINIVWRYQHYRTASKYLKGSPPIAATGGTAWQKYLSQIAQHVVFFPQLWTKESFEKAWQDSF
jgi:tryptophan 2,3-dioxygenase